MTLAAFPPHFAVGAHGYHLGRQGAVARRVPLPGDVGRQRRQIVEPLQHLPSSTVGAAAAASGAGCDGGLVVVTPFAPPPHLAVGGGRDLLGGQRAVICGVPLGGNGRKQAGKIILSGDHPPPRAVGAACPAGSSGKDGGLPRMTLFAQPPNPSPTS